MGNNRSSTVNWTADDWAYGTGENAVSIETVIDETSKIPQKYFGGETIENDASMQQMQQDLLAFDETIKNIFRRNKSRKSKQQISQTTNEYYQQQQQQYEYDQRSLAVSQSIDSNNNENYLRPTFLNTNGQPALIQVTESSDSTLRTSNRLIWRCSHCAIENKITEYVCRRCGQAETSL